MVDNLEKIKHAAILHSGIIYVGFSHAAIIHTVMRPLGLPKTAHRNQGFVTNRGRYVDREEAAEIALAAGQIEKLSHHPTELFSEELNFPKRYGNKVEKELPYLTTPRMVVDRKYNPDYGDDRKCECGHSYYRHFDSYEDMYPCGCKYCRCDDFVE